MLNQNQIENESKEINKSIIIRDLSEDNFINCPSNLYASFVFNSYDQLHSFINIFHSYTDFHTKDLDPSRQREIRDKYCRELDGDTEAIIGSYYNEDLCTQSKREKVILSMRIVKIRGQLLLLSHNRYAFTKKDMEVLHEFCRQPFLANQKGLKKQQKIFKRIDPFLGKESGYIYFNNLIKSLLDYELVTINNKEYWLNSKQRKNKNLIETLKNEAILEKL